MGNENRADKNLIFFGFWILLLLTKFYQFNYLPAKYFYDSNAILSCMQYTPEYVDKAYRFTATLFRSINIFKFTTLMQWSWLFTAVFGLVMWQVVNKHCFPMNNKQFVYLFCCVFLMGVYVFNLSKDIIQLTIFLIIYYIITTDKIKNNLLKLTLCALVMFWESKVFRAYYVLMSAFVFYVYFIINTVLKRKEKIKPKNILYIIVVTIALMTAIMIVLKTVMPSEYNSIMLARSGVNRFRENNEDANTIIIDMIETNGNLYIWVVNYVINALRMMIPVELVAKGAKYLPFVLFQIMFTGYVMKNLRDVRSIKSDKKMLSLCIVCAYLLVSFMFEPDFGSWVRHETTLTPIMFLLIFNEKEIQQEELEAVRIEA